MAVAGAGAALVLSVPIARALDEQQSKLIARAIRSQWREIPCSGMPSSFQVLYHPPGLREQLVEKRCCVH